MTHLTSGHYQEEEHAPLFQMALVHTATEAFLRKD